MNTWGFLLDSPSHWIAAFIFSVSHGVAVYRRYDENEKHQGRARQTREGWLITKENYV